MQRCEYCENLDDRFFRHCPQCGKKTKTAIIEDALNTDEGRVCLARQMVEPLKKIMEYKKWA